MNPSSAARAPAVPLSIAADGPALGLTGTREANVLLRVPDCSSQLQAATPTEPVGRLTAGWITAVQVAVAELLPSWRRPRGLVAAAAALGFACVVGAVAAVARQDTHTREQDQVTGELHGAPPWTAATVTSTAASMLEEAPLFSTASSADGDTATKPGNSSDPSTNRTPAGPCAHIEQRIDRAPPGGRFQ